MSTRQSIEAAERKYNRARLAHIRGDGPPVPKVKNRPKCACGCGKSAQWPHNGSPVFHTRLCGYYMAVGAVYMVRNGR